MADVDGEWKQVFSNKFSDVFDSENFQKQKLMRSFVCRVDLKGIVTQDHFKLRVDIVDKTGSHKSDYILEGIMAINV